MTECGDPKDNAVAERVNGIIKNELLKDMAFHSIEEVKAAVADAIDFYNHERPHMSLDWKTPAGSCPLFRRVEEEVGKPQRKILKTGGCMKKNP